MGFGSVSVRPLPMSSLSGLSRVPLRRLLRWFIETTQLAESVSIPVMLFLLRTFHNVFNFQFPRDKGGSVTESDQRPKCGGKSLHF